MPKVNFNVPFLDIDGEPVREARTNQEKQRMGSGGQMIPEVALDDSGNVLFDEISFKKIVQGILLSPYQNDENLPFADRLKRGKLARKVVTSSTANYRAEELALIQELAAKSKSTLVLLQLDELINGKDDDAESPVSESETTH